MLRHCAPHHSLPTWTSSSAYIGLCGRARLCLPRLQKCTSGSGLLQTLGKSSTTESTGAKQFRCAVFVLGKLATAAVMVLSRDTRISINGIISCSFFFFEGRTGLRAPH